MNRRELRSDLLRLAFLMGLCSAIGVYLILTTVLVTRDGVFYIEQAQQLARDPIGVCRRYPPGYPFLLWVSHGVAGWFAGGDAPMLWVYSAQAVTLLCRVLALIPLYLLGRLLVGGVNSFWALFVLVILPYPAFYGSDVLREWPYVLFLSTGMLMLYWGLSTRRWWLLAVVGLNAGLGYLIRPESVQLVAYALLSLFVIGKRGHSTFPHESRLAIRPYREKVECPLLLLAGFLVPVIPYVHASGSLLPHQLRSSTLNMLPVLSAIGSKAAKDTPLEFEVRAGELLELPIRAIDPDGDALTFSLAGVPTGSRPVYAFRSTSVGGEFWTLSEQEKERLVTTFEVWDCEGIAWYAYAAPDACPGLRPVYRFWSPRRQRHFFTMSESEKEAILAESTPESWVFEGAVFYAFGAGDHPPDAAPVYRLWDGREGYSWTMTPPAGTDPRRSTIAWYAYPARTPPAGAGIENGIFRWRPGPDQQGEHLLNIVVTDGELPCSQLVMIRVVGANPASQGFAGRGRQAEADSRGEPHEPGYGWHGQTRLAVLFGKGGPLKIHGQTSWVRPKLLRSGCCELLSGWQRQGRRPWRWLFRAVERPSPRAEPLTLPPEPTASTGKFQQPGMNPASLAVPPIPCTSRSLARGGPILLSTIQHFLRDLAGAVDELIDGLGEDFMIIPILPWILGLYWWLKNRAGALERVLIPAVLIVNLGLILGRHVWIAPGSARRYCVAMIALTIFYLPAGLDVMTRVLNHVYKFRGRLSGLGVERRPPWFYLLLLGGVVLCTPKLIFTPLRADKAGYRTAGEWLRRNTPVESIVAEPDRRIAFYAERPPMIYERYPNWRKADFVVEIAGSDRLQVPDGWTQAYSTPVGPGDDREVVVYSRTDTKRDSTAGTP